MNETIAYKCRKLKRSGLIPDFYSRNAVHIEEEERSTLMIVFRMDNLFSLFPNISKIMIKVMISIYNRLINLINPFLANVLIL